MSTYYALIMAGGTGTRLWPRSRLLHPKQFLDIAGDLTMLQESRQRIAPIIRPEHTLVATNQNYVEIVNKQLPQLPRHNILGEPLGRNTAPAIGLAAAHVFHRSPDGVMAVLTADHLIKKVDAFQTALLAAYELATQGWLVTLGIKPSYAETGYGYIERGEYLAEIHEHQAFRVARFVEKPALAQAQAYLQSGNYAWNSGMFIWKAARILTEIKAHLPELYEGLDKIIRSLDTPKYPQVLREIFPTFPSVSIDYGIMEKATEVAMVPVDIGWNDVGSWSAVFDVLPHDDLDNAVVGSHIGYDTSGSLIYSPKRFVATIGLKDVVIVDTDDVLLVCHRSRTQDVKFIVDKLKDNGDSTYLKGQMEYHLLDRDKISQLWEGLEAVDRVLLSLVLHSGIGLNEICELSSLDFDLIYGWVVTSSGKKPIADLTREAIFSWMKNLNITNIVFSSYWKDEKSIREILMENGQKIEINLTPEMLYTTLARVLFEGSDEGSVMRNMLGDETFFVQAPLEKQFPFTLKDYSTEDSLLCEKARQALNRAVTRLHG